MTTSDLPCHPSQSHAIGHPENRPPNRVTDHAANRHPPHSHETNRTGPRPSRPDGVRILGHAASRQATAGQTMARPTTAGQAAAGRTTAGRTTASREHRGVPLLLPVTNLPGPLSMRHLSSRGIMRSLDAATVYHLDQVRTVAGRGMLASIMIPLGTSACMTLAAWIWMGGDLPQTIDLLTDAHFRAPIHGRRVRAFNRNAPEGHRTTVAGRTVTTPTRTACDIALLPDDEFEDIGGLPQVGRLIEDYDVPIEDCLRILDDNRYWPNTRTARRRLEGLRASASSS